jgi:hypothetical protein
MGTPRDIDEIIADEEGLITEDDAHSIQDAEALAERSAIEDENDRLAGLGDWER